MVALQERFRKAVEGKQGAKVVLQRLKTDQTVTQPWVTVATIILSTLTSTVVNQHIFAGRNARKPFQKCVIVIIHEQ